MCKDTLGDLEETVAPAGSDELAPVIVMGDSSPVIVFGNGSPVIVMGKNSPVIVFEPRA
jgi:hypothetical protein